LMCRSTMPSDCGCRGVVRNLFTPWPRWEIKQ
jgi:hypothetical protein